jgi:hypothetical protein
MHHTVIRTNIPNPVNKIALKDIQINVIERGQWCNFSTIFAAETYSMFASLKSQTEKYH